MANKAKPSFSRFNPAEYINDAETFDVFVQEIRKTERELCVETIERRIGQHLVDNAEVDGELTMAVRSGMRLALLALHEQWIALDGKKRRGQPNLLKS